MIVLEGKYNQAVVFTEEIEEEAKRQILTFLNQPAFEGTKIAIMPDVHSGKGSVIGFTMTANSYIIPNIIGVDIGCGVLACQIGKIDFSFEKLDQFIRKNIPYGFENNSYISSLLPESFQKKVKKVCKKIGMDQNRALFSAGSLGGGNHYIEIDTEKDGTLWLVIHSGSRNFGLQVAQYHQKKAKKYCESHKISVPRDLEYMPLKQGGEEYLEDMQVAQELAYWNRKIMAARILEDFFQKDLESAIKVESIHNYIDFQYNIIRKGAISAQKDEKLIIPFSMKDGAIIGIGKGNPEWNYSAPHGAGRVLSRTKAFKTLDLEEYKKSMHGIWSSCINRKTIDESPMAYKKPQEILKYTADSFTVEKSIKPIYNFKAEGE